MTVVAYFPVVADEDTLVDIVSRAAWFLSFTSIERIYIPVASENLALMPWKVAHGMDESIADNFGLLRGKVEFVTVRDKADLEACLRQADIILQWKKDATPRSSVFNRLARWKNEKWKKGKRIFQVDPVAVRYEGSYYIDVGLHLLEDRDALIRDNQEKFRQLVNRLGRFDRAYLMATGPSVSRYKHYDYADAISIVCNSVILDEELMNHVKPEILAFADPIFHFGPSQYAAEFRQKLRESARRHDFTICIPFKHYPIFVAAVPELKDRTIAIPFVKDIPFNFDLSDQFRVRTTPNILTLLMTPIATTFANEVGYMGCDGRPLSEDKYFWSHNPKTQFNDKMANIREVHPGFFSIDYNDYYLEHCETLESMFREGEKLGKHFLSLGFSHIPAFQSRMGFDLNEQEDGKADPGRTSADHSTAAAGTPLQQGARPQISVIMPVFNAVRFLREAIDSVLSQGVADLELLVVDDGSTDGSLKIAAQMAQEDRRIRILENNRKKGVSGARNTGLGAARGKFIAFLDADDAYDPGALSCEAERPGGEQGCMPGTRQRTLRK